MNHHEFINQLDEAKIVGAAGSELVRRGAMQVVPDRSGTTRSINLLTETKYVIL